ncbi:hypothetical protein EIN_306060 [Entamoeba invadens IP1]|uniref:Uncharacterized protein n=1 Tax=Entamoeba invadens IP1 TaxID=370355 RepID=A0A0A1TYV8_ENTIV|nr:hypothetical protein EIN_306060 [Entamoeba invadens IP1]ELP86710.1 hypothetical protein EIN_306060 [Entamoeba invadens IP1]|eukprot:XP_004186056.1 hypothetical protein EIN_306060 [Entamoeba invadens IP1]
MFLLLFSLFICDVCSKAMVFTVWENQSKYGKALRRKYTDNQCYTKLGGSIMYQTIAPVNPPVITKSEFTDDVCQGDASPVLVYKPAFETDLVMNDIAFVSDIDIGCAHINGSYDGIYYTDQCFNDAKPQKYLVVKDKGKYYLRNYYYGANCEGQSTGQGDVNYKCNACVDNVFVKCYGVTDDPDVPEPSETPINSEVKPVDNAFGVVLVLFLYVMALF